MIELSDIHVTFNKGTPLETRALRGIDLTVPTGEFLTVIGSNGAGKSTALNVIAGTILAERGRVLVAERDVTRLDAHRRAPFLSRVFQDPKLGTCENLTILENFALAYARTRPRRFRLAATRAMREEVRTRIATLGLGLENRLDDKVGLLSGGQRQAVSLLMATTGETEVLLLDEHTAALAETVAQDQAQLDELAEMYAARQISAREWMAARNPIEARVQDGQRRLARATRNDAVAGFVGNGDALRTQWADLNLTRQHAIVKAVLDHAVIAGTDKRSPVFDPNRVDLVWRV